MALITTIQQLRNYVKVSYNTTQTQSLPDFEMPQWLYLKPILGETLYDALVASPTTEIYATLLDYSRALIAPMAVFHNLPFVQAQITDNGLKTVSSDTQQAAHRWEYKEVCEALQNQAGFAAERLIEYLFKNKADLSWANEAFENCIFKSGKDFAQEYFIYQPHRTFIQLLPIIKEVEDHTISTQIGAAFYKSFIAADPGSDDLKKSLMVYLRRAVANISISKAIESLAVKITANGFTVKMGDDHDDPYRSQQTASDQQLEVKRKNALEAGNKYLMQAKDLLDSNASVTVFSDYFTSTYFAAPLTAAQQAAVVDDNANRHGVFAL
jgi:hypothetical protein